MTTEIKMTIEVNESLFSVLTPLEAKRLIDNGANINEINEEGETPLFHHLYDEEMIELFIENGANTAHQNNTGDAALHKVEIASVGKQFIESDSSILNIRNQHGSTPILNAVGNPFVEPDMVENMLNHGADVNSENNLKRTTIFAVRQPEMLKLLITHGANINHVDSFGETPLDFYQKRNDEFGGHGDLIEIILEHGAKSGKDIINEKGNTLVENLEIDNFSIGVGQYNDKNVIGK